MTFAPDALYCIMNNPSTVAELIEKLKKMPQNLPVYVRPKYFGTMEPYESVSVSINGVAEMHEGTEKNVTILV